MNIHIGSTIGRLTVIKILSRGVGAKVLCRCKCGVEKSFHRVNLTASRSRSCGCLNKELLSLRQFRHGESYKRHTKENPTPEYGTWLRIKDRCENVSAASYKHYGGRGIVLCERWQTYENFIVDMGRRPTGTSIDRFPNNDGNYEPGNCRWATASEQARNKRNNFLISYNGRTLTPDAWSEVTGINASTIRRRLNLGWSAETALTRAVGPNFRGRLRSQDYIRDVCLSANKR